MCATKTTAVGLRTWTAGLHQRITQLLRVIVRNRKIFRFIRDRCQRTRAAFIDAHAHRQRRNRFRPDNRFYYWQRIGRRRRRTWCVGRTICRNASVCTTRICWIHRQMNTRAGRTRTARKGLQAYYANDQWTRLHAIPHECAEFLIMTTRRPIEKSKTNRARHNHSSNSNVASHVRCVQCHVHDHEPIPCWSVHVQPTTQPKVTRMCVAHRNSIGRDRWCVCKHRHPFVNSI